MPICLITGGAGFIGFHLCNRLLEAGFRVICMDNLITGSRSNISHLEKRANFKFIEHDVTEYIDLDESIDYILHFASPASPVDYLKFPIQTLKVGSLGTHNALGLAKAKKAKFLLASTSEIYGDPLINPQREDYWGNVNSVGPRGVYDEAKRFAEALTLAYHRTHKVDVKIARIFNTHGPRMRKEDGRAIPNFINQALNGKPITVFGAGSQTRSFCCIFDLIEGIYKLMLSDLNKPVNLGNPQESSILDLAKTIISLTESQSRIVYKELPEDDPKVRRPDITRAKKKLNWEPKVTLEEGLKKTIVWFKTSYKAQDV
ncbi:SDR family oxidoreductase [candidate division NPL-UPA2 bacterium]|nr:SDR family oxidoreductase [candidate division NPL-UPA2 bacterium]